jgi:glycosyltransferase involved in cell wall biosynthesis
MNYLSNLDFFSLSVLVVFSLAFLIQLFYYLFFFLRIAFYREPETKVSEQFPVSIIICAKNEAAQLEAFLPSVLEQDYPDYEVIVVNDGSDDGTEDILKLYQNKYERLYVTTIPRSGNFGHNKKLAISIGLKAAKHDWVLLTDADCKPVSNEWIKLMQQKFDKKTDFVIGYGGYKAVKGFLNKIIRYDTLTIALQYFTFAMAKIPYMGVGRNLAYRKSIFFQNKGFSSHLRLASGDDDLFVNENANKQNLKISLNKKAFTESIPKKRFNAWFYQKKRHITTAKYYKGKHKFILGLEVFSRILFYAAFLTGLFFPKILIILLAGFLIRFILLTIILSSASAKFNEKGIYYLGIIFDFLLPIINFIVLLSNLKLRKRKK